MWKMKSLIGLTLAWTILLAAPMPLHALLFDRIPSLNEMAGMTRLAFRGQVIDIAYGQLNDPALQHPYPYTKVTFKVEKGFRGVADGATIVIRHAGGQGTENGKAFSMSISGVPWYQVGDRAVIFANDAIHPDLGSLYADAGVSRIVREPDGKDYVLTNSWTPLVNRSDGKIGISRQRRCVPVNSDRSQCQDWQIKDESSDATDAPTTVSESLFEATAFDAILVNAMRNAAAPSGPAQVANQDDAQFETALRPLAR